MNIQGSCAVQAFNETILILGGKNEQNFSHGSNMIWPFDPVNGSFESPTQWPSMRFDRYFHGCSVIEYNGVPCKYSPLLNTFGEGPVYFELELLKIHIKSVKISIPPPKLLSNLSF